MPDPTPIRPRRDFAGPPSDAPDPEPFDFDDLSYDINEFYVKASETKGVQGRVIRVPIDPQMYSAITRWLQINRFPKYRTVADVLRDALRHRLEYLNQGHPDAARDDEMWKALDVYSRAARLDAHKAEREANLSHFENLKAELSAAVGDLNYGSLDQMLDEAADALDHTPNPWREKTRELIAQYRVYLEGKTW